MPSKYVLITDKSDCVWLKKYAFISLNVDDHRICRGQRGNPAVIIERHTAIKSGVTVWKAIWRDSGLSLVLMQDTLRAHRYVDVAAGDTVLPMLLSCLNAIYQKYNVRPDTLRFSQKHIQGYVRWWPARWPDLIPIEDVWRMLGRRFHPSRNTIKLAD